MSWDYDPKDADKPVLDVGYYDAVILKAEPHTSKSTGEIMRKLIVKVYPHNADEQPVLIYDYIGKKSMWKAKSIAHCIGQSDEFEAKKFDPCNLSEVNIKVKVTQSDNPQGGKQNNIGGYMNDFPAQSGTPENPEPSRSIPITNTRSGAGGYSPPKGVPAPADIDVPF